MRSPPNRVEPALLDILLPENLTDVRTAIAEAGLRRLSYGVVLRAWHSGKLEAVKIGGRVMTTSAAIRRWIARANERPIDLAPVKVQRRGRRALPVTSEAERRVLESFGLPSGSRPR